MTQFDIRLAHTPLLPRRLPSAMADALMQSFDDIFGPELLEPRPLPDGGERLRAKAPFLRQLDVFGQPANPTASEDHLKALSIERERTLEDALADGEVCFDEGEEHHKRHKHHKKEKKNKKDETVVEEQSAPTPAEEVVEEAAKDEAVVEEQSAPTPAEEVVEEAAKDETPQPSNLQTPAEEVVEEAAKDETVVEEQSAPTPAEEVTEAEAPQPSNLQTPAEEVVEEVAREVAEEPETDARVVLLGDPSRAERDPDVAAILDDPETLELFTLMRQEVKDSDIGAFAVLRPYLSKHSEVLYTYGNIGTQSAIVAELPVYKEGTGSPSTNPLEDETLFAASTKDLPKVLRRVNVLKFTVEGGADLPHVFATFAKAVHLSQTDHINVYKRSETEFCILWFKNDQRTVKFPPEFKFTGRHTLCTARAAAATTSISTRSLQAL